MTRSSETVKRGLTPQHRATLRESTRCPARITRHFGVADSEERYGQAGLGPAAPSSAKRGDAMSYSHSTAVCFRAQRVNERTTVSLTRRSETVKRGLAPQRAKTFTTPRRPARFAKLNFERTSSTSRYISGICPPYNATAFGPKASENLHNAAASGEVRDAQ